MKIFQQATISQPKTMPTSKLSNKTYDAKKGIQGLHDLIFPYALTAWEEQAYMVDMLTASLLIQDPLTYGPTLKRCKFVSSNIYFNLNRNAEFLQAYSVQYADTYQITEHGKDTHAFIIITSKQTGKNYIVDAQYQQFVDEQNRKDLPEIMIFEFATNEDLITGLNEYNVPNRSHCWWLQSEELVKSAA